MRLLLRENLRWGRGQPDERVGLDTTPVSYCDGREARPGSAETAKVESAARKRPQPNQNVSIADLCLKYRRNDANSMLIKKLPVKSQPFICPNPGS